ncbi:MAG: two-component sensor histidine kinase [SAR116 cluster bacterium MED-G06]|nr:MAG: two-component sensor histidine kinase [SAR116 cluster bacterium MED-G06]|tara:strand:+ start:774 stop:2093 length:1320 start_codon:yes stop_codon:yes gene_type:complete
MQFRNYLPKTLFGRMLSIIMIPMILVQLLTIFIFYERHWDTVTRHMASQLAADISLLTDRLGSAPDEATVEVIQATGWQYFTFPIQHYPDADFVGQNSAPPASFAEQMLRRELGKRVQQPWYLDIDSDPNLIYIDLQLDQGILRIFASRKRIFSSTGWTFFGWTLGSSILLFTIALIFMRGQVQPILRLANAARALGLGRQASDYQLEGAREVRLAGRAFQAMRHRIMRQLNERTEMLAGVSHDLRTPLTRIRLQLALMGENEDATAIRADLAEMEDMIDAYLSFAAGEGEEPTEDTDVTKMLDRLTTQARNAHAFDISFTPPQPALPIFPLRRKAMRRAFENLISNAVAYSTKAEITARYRNDEVTVIFDDNGAGIPAERRDDAVRPFVRLETSRNRQTGGTGLGLSITSDIVLGHGGELSLEDSPLGGLRVVIKLPV